MLAASSALYCQPVSGEPICRLFILPLLDIPSPGYEHSLIELWRATCFGDYKEKLCLTDRSVLH
jgi:hypothetical protein